MGNPFEKPQGQKPKSASEETAERLENIKELERDGARVITDTEIRENRAELMK